MGVTSDSHANIIYYSINRLRNTVITLLSYLWPFDTILQKWPYTIDNLTVEMKYLFIDIIVDFDTDTLRCYRKLYEVWRGNKSYNSMESLDTSLMAIEIFWIQCQYFNISTLFGSGDFWHNSLYIVWLIECYFRVRWSISQLHVHTSNICYKKHYCMSHMNNKINLVISYFQQN